MYSRQLEDGLSYRHFQRLCCWWIEHGEIHRAAQLLTLVRVATIPSTKSLRFRGNQAHSSDSADVIAHSLMSSQYLLCMGNGRVLERAGVVQDDLHLLLHTLVEFCKSAMAITLPVSGSAQIRCRNRLWCAILRDETRDGLPSTESNLQYSLHRVCLPKNRQNDHCSLVLAFGPFAWYDASPMTDHD